ncbi:head-tail connector protein [Paenibacillus aquistagni]|uniref:head-tail connector protein n=1 Tax=Paenibacillus aquistagni TaxID=1852522 RepID=UPI000A1CD2F2|nr:head-tail connector protein [Paenibacillus aquistagni]
MELSSVKGYLRVDFDEDDLLINGLILATKVYLRDAGVPEQAANELYNMVVLMLVAFFYENRSSDVGAIPSTISHLITQLSCSGVRQ